jgi:hypothetical protein
VDVVLAIIAIWAIIIPLVILAVSWEAANRRDARAARARRRTCAQRRPGGVPRCTQRAAHPSRTITRRLCTTVPRTRRRPASA